MTRDACRCDAGQIMGSHHRLAMQRDTPQAQGVRAATSRQTLLQAKQFAT